MYLQALAMYPADTPEILALKNLRSKSLRDNYPNLEESKAKYTKKIKENPDSSDYLHLGNIEFINENYEKAAELYAKAKEVYEEKICVS